jgi:hypothetical protein
MVNKKDLILVALATFCLTATLFMVKPTGSQSQVGLSPRNTYDSWVDLNDNGEIDIYDAILFAQHFGTSGDPAKNVNVTNPRAQVIEKDVNISVYGGHPFPLGTGTGSTDPFETEGYDRMFVSAAIVDVSDYYIPRTTVNLYRLNWHWGTVNETDMMTYAAVGSDSNKTRVVIVDLYNASDIPVSSENSAEFEVRASKCSLSFSAITDNEDGWVLVRVSIYLTVGTTSPPVVQNTYVTNMPSSQPEPAFTTDWNYVFTPITSGYGSNSTYIYVGGYSRMFVSIEVVNASYYGVSAKTTITLTSIYWDDQEYEPVPPGVLNATYYGTFLPAYSQQVPPEFKTKGSYCHLNFSIGSEASFGWIEWYAKVYLRNE